MTDLGQSGYFGWVLAINYYDLEAFLFSFFLAESQPRHLQIDVGQFSACSYAGVSTDFHVNLQRIFIVAKSLFSRKRLRFSFAFKSSRIL